MDHGKGTNTELRQRRRADPLEAGRAGGWPRLLDRGVVRRRACEPLDDVPEVALADIVDWWLGWQLRRCVLIVDGGTVDGGLSEIWKNGVEIIGDDGFSDEGFRDFVGELVCVEVFEGIALSIEVAGKLSGGGARLCGPGSHFLRL